MHPVRTFPRPGARFSEACTWNVHVFLRFYHYYILRGCMEKIPGAQFLGELHSVVAQNKALIWTLCTLHPTSFSISLQPLQLK